VFSATRFALEWKMSRVASRGEDAALAGRLGAASGLVLAGG